MSNSQQTRSLTKRLTEARDAGDAEAIGALLAEDVVLQMPGSLGVGPVPGREVVANVLSGMVAQTYLQPQSIRREQLLMVVDDDVAVVKSRLSGRTMKDAEYENEYVNVYFWRDGALARIEEHPDTLRFAQHGLVTLPQDDEDER